MGPEIDAKVAQAVKSLLRPRPARVRTPLHLLFLPVMLCTVFLCTVLLDRALPFAGALLLPRAACAQTVDAGAGVGMLGGRLFTADHPESLAVGAEVFLLFETPAGSKQLVTRSDSGGAYVFTGLSTEGTIQYVLRVDYRGNNFLGAPLSFSPGQTQLSQSFLVSTTAPPVGGGAGAGEGQMPANHPPVPGQEGRPVAEKPGDAIGLTVLLLALFGLPLYLMRSREGAVTAPRPSGAVESLIRDIAALDLRHETGVIDREDYERVRGSLKRRLSELTGAAGSPEQASS
ncbi:MAG: hypothetical protein IT349_13340 [Candidatus Eisenbacteria bacterium]|nr:hypothetical protein [Candidatus Eisenbacteria bacterium]MCC7143080.1 hypothetical protein [Candidatus Eisenbacteria bacterium]